MWVTFFRIDYCVVTSTPVQLFLILLLLSTTGRLPVVQAICGFHDFMNAVGIGLVIIGTGISLVWWWIHRHTQQRPANSVVLLFLWHKKIERLLGLIITSTPRYQVLRERWWYTDWLFSLQDWRCECGQCLVFTRCVSLDSNGQG